MVKNVVNTLCFVMISAVIVSIVYMFMTAPANAQQNQKNTLSPVGQQQQQQQHQQQQQEQKQQQQQKAIAKSKAKANNEGVTAVNNNEFDDKRDAPSISVDAPGFGSSVSDGYLNACAGTEAWSIGLGGSFLNAGSPIGAGIGGGSSDVVTINLCEVREAAHLVQMRGTGEKAEELHHAIMCQHPSYRAAAVAIDMGCPDIPPYTMEVATQQQVEEAQKSVQRVSEKSSGTHCQYGMNEWGRCINPDYDS